MVAAVEARAAVKVNAELQARAHRPQELLQRVVLRQERRQLQAQAVDVVVAAVNAAAERAADSGARVFHPTEFPTPISGISAPVSQMAFHYNPGRPTSSSSAWRTTAKTTPTPTACRWVSCSFIRIRNREK